VFYERTFDGEQNCIIRIGIQCLPQRLTDVRMTFFTQLIHLQLEPVFDFFSELSHRLTRRDITHQLGR